MYAAGRHICRSIIYFLEQLTGSSLKNMGSKYGFVSNIIWGMKEFIITVTLMPGLKEKDRKYLKKHTHEKNLYPYLEKTICKGEK